MVTLCCTKRLLSKLGLPASQGSGDDALSSKPTTALGDWYATLIYTRPRHLVLFVSERSRLAVVVPAAPLATLTGRFRDSLLEVLQALEVSPDAIAREVRAMEPCLLGPTRDRSVVGTMNEYVKMVEDSAADGHSPLQTSVWLSRTLWRPLGWRYPAEVTRELLEAPDVKG